MEFGFYLPTHGPLATRQNLLKISEHAEKLGFDSMVAGDHVIAPINPTSQYPYSVGSEVPWDSSGEHLEMITELAFLAAVTQHIKLVTSVMIVPHRNPILTAKMLSTLDVLSEGRLVVGIGVGWLKEEFDALKTPPFNKRGKATDEYIEIFKTLWSEQEPSYKGEFYSFEPIQFAPKPIQIPGPDIWVGGQSRAAIRRAAKLGNAWHPVGANPASPLEPEEISEEIDYLKTYCESLKRDPSEVIVVLKAPIYDKENNYGGKRRRFSGSPDQICDDIQEYQNLGVSHLVLDTRSNDLSASIEKMDWLHEEVIIKSKN
jgi:probable F420-dependent oxidoreductase